ncbi:MAG: DNRLRE domain-containing protein [Candidatus Thermoplasmatota archaeon]|nr:DNRLRE domain-containing protein [Candidatus Thermoplasmatota archaeon]
MASLMQGPIKDRPPLKSIAGRSAAALVMAMLIAPLLLILPNASSSDPAPGTNPDMTRTLTWSFDDPANFTTTDAEVSGGCGSLLWSAHSFDEDSEADYSGGITKDNIDISSEPGSVIVDVEEMTVYLTVLQPGSEGKDTYIKEDASSTNYGSSTNLNLDGEVGRQNRVLISPDLTSLPTSAVVLDATLWLYMRNSKGAQINYTAYAITRSWVEMEANWESYEFGKNWTTPGGDHDALPFCSGTIDFVVGWYGLDLSLLIDLWLTDRADNCGIIIVPEATAESSTKTFVSSDDIARPNESPKVVLNYTLGCEQGIYESAAIGPGTNTTFRTASWNASYHSALTNEFSGGLPSSRWSWTNDPSDGYGSWDVGTTYAGYLHVEGEGERVLNGSTMDAHYLHEDVTGAFDARTHLFTSFTANSMGAGMLMLDDSSNWLAAVLTGTGPNARISAIATEAGLTSTLAEEPWTGQADAHIRLIRNGTEATVYYGPDGVVWNELITYNFSMPLQTMVQIGPCVYSGSSPSTPLADFDFLRVEPLIDATAIQVRVRLGNSPVPGDLTWEPWGEALSSPHVLDRDAKYLQYQVSLETGPDWYSPSFDGFYCGHQMYATSGTIETMDLTVDHLRRWLTITCSEELNGGDVSYSYSTNHGSSWTPLVTGVSNSISDTAPDIKLRIVFGTTDTLKSPRVDSIVAQYSVAASSFHLSTPATVMAGEPFSVTIEARDENNVKISHWTGSVALTAMDEDGTSLASSNLAETSAWISTGGSVLVADEAYTVAETIRISASAEGAYGLSEPITVLPGPVSRVEITPRLETVLEYSDVEFAAIAYDSYDNVATDYACLWSADEAVGTVNATAGKSVTLQTGIGGQSGYLTAHVGELSDSILLMVVPPTFSPEIVGSIGEQVRPEDYGTWSLNISSMVSDVEDTWMEMRWYVTNEWLVTVSGENRTGDMRINFTTKQDLFGSNVLHLVVVDSDGMTASTEFVVTVTPVNDPPSIDHIAPLTVTHDVEYNFDFRYHISDVDDTVDELVLSVDDASAAYATVKWLVIGFLYPSALNGIQQFVTVRVTDGVYSSSTTLIVSVSSDKVPYSRAIPALSLDQGQTALNVLDLGDYFDDLDDSVLFYSVHSHKVSVTIHPNHTVDVAAPIYWWGVEDVIFTASDEEGARCEEVMTVTVRHVNQPPSIKGVPDLVVRYDLQYEFDLTPYISDADNAIETLHISTDNSYIAVIGCTISLLFPRSLDGHVIEVTLQVGDGELSDSCSISVSVSPNLPPMPLDLTGHAFLEDGEVPYPVGECLVSLFTDPDGDDDELVFLAFTSTECVNATAATNDLGQWFVWFDTEDNWNGICSLTVRAVDPQGGLVERTVELEVIPQPDPPQLMTMEPIMMEAGTQRMLDLTQFVYDPDSASEKFLFSAMCEEGQYVDVRGSVLVLSFTEAFLGRSADSRVSEIEVTVLDEGGYLTSGILTVTVIRPPGSGAQSQLWFYAGMILTGGVAIGLFVMAFGTRRKPFVVRDMMLIHNDGFLIGRHATPKEGEIDGHILTSMLTTVLNFVDDTMAAGGRSALRTFGFRDYQVIVDRGAKVFVAIAYEGDLPEGIDETMDGFLKTVERIYKKKLENWSGDIEKDFAGVEMLIQSFVKDHSRRKKVKTETVWKTRATDRMVRPRVVSIPIGHVKPAMVAEPKKRIRLRTRKLRTRKRKKPERVRTLRNLEWK